MDELKEVDKLFSNDVILMETNTYKDYKTFQSLKQLLKYYIGSPGKNNSFGFFINNNYHRENQLILTFCIRIKCKLGYDLDYYRLLDIDTKDFIKATEDKWIDEKYIHEYVAITLNQLNRNYKINKLLDIAI